MFGKLFLRRVSIDVESSRPEAFPFTLPAVRTLSEESLEFSQRVTIFVGENGSGKSTILESIAVALGLNPEGGSRNFFFCTRPSHSSLHHHLRLVRSLERPRDLFFLRAESYFNLASDIEHLDREAEASGASELGPTVASYFGDGSLHERSHGESFMALFEHRLEGPGLYLLDEPEAALSPLRQLELVRRMHTLAEGGSQFIVATHSPILLAFPGARVLAFSEDGISPTAYDQTEHFLVMRRFVEHPERMLRELLEP